ncbi:DUF4145 domain-containing protein [Bacillus halotolerans]|uniref:DUF4145 domain-containing protein n=1 Tax=Bacillus halotolerans TaxID=260554 RepID=UPI002DB9BBF3|nr:DUF4145 domain-containing protein [Bacillus halotolerans]MEC1648738.1 DUF4145 domain-containing protein [Bacillus halotolerans]
MIKIEGQWIDTDDAGSLKFECSNCNNKVAAKDAYYNRFDNFTYFVDAAVIAICPYCDFSTLLIKDISKNNEVKQQIPAPRIGSKVPNLPSDIDAIYNEIQICISNNAFTAGVILARKLLMNVAVSQGAKENESFYYYVKFLDEENYIPKNSKGWVDIIRGKGNDATHKIPSIDKSDAYSILEFTSMLLRLLYEFPAKLNQEKI